MTISIIEAVSCGLVGAVTVTLAYLVHVDIMSRLKRRDAEQYARGFNDHAEFTRKARGES